MASIVVGTLGQPLASPGADGVPAHLADTGLYADFATRTLAPGVVAFSPQYPLWSDGATKRRWIRLPEGGTIDASDPDAWRFPVGTRIWKEFSFERPVETRFMEKTFAGEWLFATYRWDEAGADALRVPEKGIRHAAESRPGVPYDLPGLVECRACHESGLSPVLGFSALQLSSDRDPGAPHATPPEPGSVDLPGLLQRGLLVGLPAPLAAHPPRVRAADPTTRSALGYLHANCSNCHNPHSPIAGLGLSLTVWADGTPAALTTAVGQPSLYRPTGTTIGLRIAPGDPATSLLVARLSDRGTVRQMPPMDSHLVDDEGLDLVMRWIAGELGTLRVETPVAVSYPARSSGSSGKENP